MKADCPAREPIDPQKAAENLLRMFDIKRLPLPREVYMTEKELDDENIAYHIARGCKKLETPSYTVTVERK